MILNKNQIIEANIFKNDVQKSQLQPTSVDLLLANEFLVYKKSFLRKNKVFATTLYKNKKIKSELKHAEGSFFRIKPKQFVLASTKEHVSIPNNLVGRVDGKSSFGRIGLLIHVTAGYIDTGFKGNITLELYNLSDNDIYLHVGTPICQLSLHTVDTIEDADLYKSGNGNNYQHQSGVTESKFIK